VSRLPLEDGRSVECRWEDGARAGSERLVVHEGCLTWRYHSEDDAIYRLSLWGEPAVAGAAAYVPVATAGPALLAAGAIVDAADPGDVVRFGLLLPMAQSCDSQAPLGRLRCDRSDGGSASGEIDWAAPSDEGWWHVGGHIRGARGIAGAFRLHLFQPRSPRRGRRAGRAELRLYGADAVPGLDAPARVVAGRLSGWLDDGSGR